MLEEVNGNNVAVFKWTVGVFKNKLTIFSGLIQDCLEEKDINFT